MSKAKILIVDDDPDFVEYIRTVLEANDYQTASAGNSDQGMRVLSRDKPDLVVLDVIMSSILDGLTLSQRMAEDPALMDIPIIMVTSIANTDYLALFPTDENIHIDAFLTKPIAPAELLRQIERLLDGK
ncbi:MAG: Response regulator PleD [Chloroflexi bacterium ADurb.Bin325]|nr:MAG: Response regulator PleD [Chloroflexi bacterium ADurb.Bin325]